MSKKLHPAEPELGQLIWSNSPTQEFEAEAKVQLFIEVLGCLIEEGGLSDSYVPGNSGDSYENDVFQMRSYCWCDGDRHPQGCPPNFVWRGFQVSWYKYVGRSITQNRGLTSEEYLTMTYECFRSVYQALRTKGVMSWQSR